MKNSCEIVKDLLPLYHDDVCSNESRSMVEEHLLECNVCKGYLDSMNSDFIQSDIEEQVKFDKLKGIKKKLFRKKVIISAISVLCSMMVFLGVFSVIFHYQIPIPYEDGLLSVDEADDRMIDIVFNGKDYYSSYGLTKTIKQDGVKYNIAFVYYTDSIWTKYFSKPRNNGVSRFSIENSITDNYDKNGEVTQSKNDITAVYYLIADYNSRDFGQLSNEEFVKVMQDAILIWEK